MSIGPSSVNRSKETHSPLIYGFYFSTSLLFWFVNHEEACWCLCAFQSQFNKTQKSFAGSGQRASKASLVPRPGRSRGEDIRGDHGCQMLKDDWLHGPGGGGLCHTWEKTRWQDLKCNWTRSLQRSASPPPPLRNAKPRATHEGNAVWICPLFGGWLGLCLPLREGESADERGQNNTKEMLF